jgi:hypothetical protein
LYTSRVMIWRKKPKNEPPALPPPEEPADDGEEVPRDPRYWMERLAKRAARLQRLQEIKAPQKIIDQERRLIGEAIAMLPPRDALAVLQRSTDLARHLDRSEGAGPEREGDPAPRN